MLFSDHSTLLFNQLCSSSIFRACLTSELRATPLYLVGKHNRLQHLSLSRSLALSLSPSLTLSLSLVLVLWGDPWFGCHLSWIFCFRNGNAIGSGLQPGTWKSGRRTGDRPAGQPGSQPTGQAASRPGNHTAMQPAGKAAGRPGSQAGGGTI